MREQPRFDISLWGIQISGHGATGIIAAVAIIGMFALIYRFDFCYAGSSARWKKDAATA